MNDKNLNNQNLTICEIFNSVSGEGLHAGSPATFIRFSGCNMSCSYCDTKYHDEIAYCLNTDYIEINNEVSEKLKNRKYVILTGGEPYLQNHEELKKLAEWLFKNGTQLIEIETNGKHLDEFIGLLKDCHNTQKLCFCADFKTECMNDHEYLISAILGYKKLNKNDCIKVVVKSTEDIKIAKELADKFTNTNVLVSPCFGVISPTEIAEYIIKNDYQNLRTQVQLHKILWEVNARGK